MLKMADVLTRPPRPRRDASFPGLRSRSSGRLNVSTEHTSSLGLIQPCCVGNGRVLARLGRVGVMGILSILLD